MEFKLNEYHRNISDEELINDMHNVVHIINKDSLHVSDYKKYGKYSFSTIEKRFGSWEKACMKANISLCRSQNRSLTNEELLLDIIRVKNELGINTITQKVYDEYGIVHSSTICGRFGTWNNALILAKVELSHEEIIRDIDLLNDIEDVWITLGKQPTTTDIKNGKSRYSLNTFIRHFGTWRKALEAFVDYINNDNRDENETSVAEHGNETIVPVIYNKPNDTNKTKRDINLRLRFKVMQRDNFKCCMCGASPATDSSVVLHIDHIKPWSKGGETVIDNLQTLCSKCNLGKSDLEL